MTEGMWLDYGGGLCQPDVFDRALSARISELSNIKIRQCLTMRPRAVLEADPDGHHIYAFNLHYSSYDRRKHDEGRCNYLPVNLGEIPDYYRPSSTLWTSSFSRLSARWRRPLQSQCRQPLASRHRRARANGDRRDEPGTDVCLRRTDPSAGAGSYSA